MGVRDKELPKIMGANQFTITHPHQYIQFQ
jgi:hypothetical protein